MLPDYVFPNLSWNEVADRILADRRFPSELWDLAGSVSKPHEIQISDVIGFCNISNCDAFIVRGGGSLSLDDLALELIDVAEDHDRSSLKIKIDRDITRGGGITIAANVPDPESPIEANPFNLIVQEAYGDDAIFYYYRIRKTDHRVFVGPDAFGRTDCVVAMTFARLNSKGGRTATPCSLDCRHRAIVQSSWGFDDRGDRREFKRPSCAGCGLQKGELPVSCRRNGARGCRVLRDY